MPEGIDTNLDFIEETLKKELNPQKMERVPIAFGLNSIEIIKLVEEKEGELERVTNVIKKIEGVRQVEIKSLTRSL